MAAIQSPCIKICVLDPKSGVCIGCGRTLNEIGRWLSLSESERSSVMAELPRRLAALKTDRTAKAEPA
jgi:predicted Fe-S protein YdhL (DUF1289 family)